VFRKLRLVLLETIEKLLPFPLYTANLEIPQRKREAVIGPEKVTSGSLNHVTSDCMISRRI